MYVYIYTYVHGHTHTRDFFFGLFPTFSAQTWTFPMSARTMRKDEFHQQSSRRSIWICLKNLIIFP